MSASPKSHLLKPTSATVSSHPHWSKRAGRLEQHILREYTLRPGRVVVRGQASHRDKASMLRADYVLFHKPNVPLAVVEAKDAKHSVGAGMAFATHTLHPRGQPPGETGGLSQS